MTPDARHGVAWCLAFVLLALTGSADFATAQAWVAPARVGSISFAVQAIDNTGHRSTNGTFIPDGQSVNRSVSVDVDYAFTDRFSVSFGVPYVGSKFTGANPPPGRLPGDLCHCWHTGWQDLTLTARFNVIDTAVGFTPYVTVSVPSHSYEYRGEAVLGRDLREMRVGAAVGRRLDAISERLSVQGNYSYALVEHVAGVSNNRSNAAFEGDVEITRRLAVRGLLLWQRTHGGLRTGNDHWPEGGYPWGEITTAELFDQHDRLLRDNHWRVGTGASYALPRVEIFAVFVGYLSGTDAHGGRAVTIGLTLPFERSR